MADLAFEPKDVFSMRRLRIAEAIRAVELGIHDDNVPDFFHALVRSLVLTLRMEYAFVSEFLGEKEWRVRTLGLWITNHFGENTELAVLNYFAAGVGEEIEKKLNSVRK